MPVGITPRRLSSPQGKEDRSAQVAGSAIANNHHVCLHPALKNHSTLCALPRHFASLGETTQITADTEPALQEVRKASPKTTTGHSRIRCQLRQLQSPEKGSHHLIDWLLTRRRALTIYSSSRNSARPRYSRRRMLQRPPQIPAMPRLRCRPTRRLSSSGS